MIKINQIKIPVFTVGKDKEKEILLLKRSVSSKLCCKDTDIRKIKIIRKSIDAREKNNILFVYTVNVKLKDSVTGTSLKTEAEYIKQFKSNDISIENFVPLEILHISDEFKLKRPVIIGSGPCGLFAAITFIKSGLKPLIIERGDSMEKRFHVTENSYKTAVIDKNSNVLFGEGGAGTFSDGKLTTSVKGQDKYIRFILETFVSFGADECILIDQKPHIGTDVLREVIVAIRKYITENGGEYLFNTVFEDFSTDSFGNLTEITVSNTKTGEKTNIKTDNIILATGHSARDTYEMLFRKNVSLEQKPFAIGVRVQHPQALIDAAMYGSDDLLKKTDILGPVSYKLTYKANDGRGVYSFCMCPGGYVINASSENGMLNINGMSYHDRASGTANSAILVNINPSDFEDDSPLSGIKFQRELEKKAFNLSQGLIPYETYKEFKNQEKNPIGNTSFDIKFKGLSFPCDVAGILPEFVHKDLCDGLEYFNRIIKGFNSDDTVIAGIEARTSSPVRISRDESYFSNIKGIIPAGEGAGYAGGITSAAADGIRAALKYIEFLEPIEEKPCVDSVIFDIDGTMWDSTKSLAKAYTKASEKLGFYKTFEREDLLPLLGSTNKKIFSKLYPEVLDEFGVLSKEAELDNIIKISTSYETDFVNKFGGEVYEGLEKTLKYLSERTRLYIVSNCHTSYIDEFLNFTGFRKFFSGSLCQGDTGEDKGYTLLALKERYGLKSPIYIGDIENDANACIFAKIPFIWASYGFGDVPKEKCLFKIGRPDEIIGKLSFK